MPVGTGVFLWKSRLGLLVFSGFTSRLGLISKNQAPERDFKQTKQQHPDPPGVRFQTNTRTPQA